MISKQQISKIKELAKFGNKNEHFFALIEEVGEIGKDLCEKNEGHAAKEVVDSIIAHLALFFTLGGTEELFKSRMERSIKKWENKNVKSNS